MPEKKSQMEAIYRHMWASHEGGPFAPLDESLHPRPHSMLYEVVSTCGVSSSSLVLDIGSGRGNHSCALAQRFGCAVVGLDVAHPEWRASAVGVYRLWRDSGYAIGALLAGVLADLFGVLWAIGVIGVLTILSGIVVKIVMSETLPRTRLAQKPTKEIIPEEQT